MKFFLKYYTSILILFLSFSFSFSFSTYASGNNLFLQEIQSQREIKANLNLLNLSYATNSSYSVDLISVQINPFYKLKIPLNNLSVRLNYINYNIDKLYYNKNSEIAFVYNIINYELLTLYINYAIYSMYNLRFYDFVLDKEVSVARYGKSFSAGIDAEIFRNIYLNLEKRWVRVDDNYIKGLDSFYIGLKYKVPFKVLQES